MSNTPEVPDAVKQLFNWLKAMPERAEDFQFLIRCMNNKAINGKIPRFEADRLKALAEEYVASEEAKLKQHLAFQKEEV